MQQKFKKLTLLSMAVSSAMVLSACSNGNSVGGQIDKPHTTTMPKNNVKMVTSQNVEVLAESDTKNVTNMNIIGEGKLSITLPKDAETLKVLDKGEVLYLPPSEELPFGYSGVVEQKNTDGTVVMREATLTEVFDELDIDFNSSRDTENLQVGLISANPNVKMQIQPQGHQVGVLDDFEKNYQSCELENTKYNFVSNINKWLNNYADKIPELQTQATTTEKFSFPLPTFKKSVDLGFTQGCEPIQENRFAKENDKIGAKYNVNLTLPVIDEQLDIGINFDLADVLMKQKMKYKNQKWENFEYSVSGNLSAKFSLNGKVESNLSELLGTDKYSKVWDSLKLEIGGKKNGAKLYGLDSEDKKGLLPLGGFLVSATTVANQTYVNGNLGNISTQKLTAHKPLALIIWFYLRADGTVSLEGEIATGMEKMQFQKGVILKPNPKDPNELIPEVLNDSDEPALYFSASAKAGLKTTLGATISTDLVVAGIRPVTMQINPIKYTQDTELELLGKYTYFSNNPKYPKGFDGSACLSQSTGVTSDLWLSTKLGAEVRVLGWKKSGELAYESTLAEKVWKNPDENKVIVCNTKTKLNAIFTPTPVSNAPKVYNLDVDFSKSFLDYREEKEKGFIDNWKIKVYNHNTKQHSYITLPENSNGKATFSLPYGYNYDVAVVAMGNPFSEKQEIEIAKSNVANFNLGTDPSKVKVTSVDVSPKQPTIGEKYRVTIKGDMLLSNFNLSGCSSPKLIDFSQYQAIYECTAPNAGQSLLLNISSADGKHQYHKVGVEIQAITPISANLLEFLSEPRYYLEPDNSRYGKLLFTKGTYSNGMTNYVLNEAEYKKDGNKWRNEERYDNNFNFRIKGNDIFLDKKETATLTKINDLSTQGYPKGAKSYDFIFTYQDDFYDIYKSSKHIHSIDVLLNDYQTINQIGGSTLWLDKLLDGTDAVFSFDTTGNTVQIYQRRYDSHGNSQQTKIGTGTWQRVNINGDDIIKVQPPVSLYHRFLELNNKGVARVYVKSAEENGIKEGVFRAKGVQENDTLYNKIAINHLMNKNKLPTVVD